ncbi:MAG: hypothetical protein KKB20_02195 [Proteobacteria bacterium]|nr:hypothetical protein [Pseudomonadota bacterium]
MTLSHILKGWPGVLLLCLMTVDFGGCTACMSSCAGLVVQDAQMKASEDSRQRAPTKVQVYDDKPGPSAQSPASKPPGEEAGRVETSSLTQRRSVLESHLQKYIGRLDYDEALLLLGRPTNLTHGDRLFVASWLGGTGGIDLNLDGTTVRVNPGEELQLIFDKGTRKLISWRYQHE